jgi:hypothetical protein
LPTRIVNRLTIYDLRLTIAKEDRQSSLEPQVPLGEINKSSRSREQGRAAMEFFTSIKTVYMDRAGI